MNSFHFRKIKQLKDWERDLSAVLTFKSNEMDEETKNDTRLYRDLLAYAIRQAERVQDLENHLKLYEFWYRTAYEQNKRYREALELLVKQETIGNDVKTGKTAISYNGMIALKGLGVFNDDNYIVYGVDEIIESVSEESK